ncbi:MAG: alpha/beta fold hydrolase [Anaerolineae bacterium]
MAEENKGGCLRRGLTLVGVGLAVIVAAGFMTTAIIANRAERVYPPEGEFVTVDGATLHYVRAGSGQPLIYLPCGGCPLQSFTMSEAFERAVETYDVIVFDRYGLGHSDLGTAHALPSEQAALIHGALQQLDIENPVLVGHSASGAVALAYADRYETQGVVIMAGAVYESEGGTALLQALATPVLGDVLINVIYVPVFNILVSVFGAGQGGPDRLPAEYIRVSTALGSRPQHIKAAAAHTLGINAEAPALSQTYSTLDVPVIYLAGSEDNPMFAQMGERLAAELPNGQFEVVEGAGHSLYFSQPEALLDAIGRIRSAQE